MTPAAPTVRVSFADVAEGRAYLRIPPVGKILLAHWAGAPWSDKDDDACLSALQAEVLFRKEREKIVHGGSGLGKSVLGGCDLMVANMLPHRKIAVVADRYDHVSHEFAYLYAGMKTLFKDHHRAIKRLSFRNQQNYHEYDCEMVWGTRTWGISTQSDEGAQLLGREFTDAICGEASHITVGIFNTRLLRALDRSTMARKHGMAQETGTLSMYTTPDKYAGASAYEWERIRKQTKNQPHLLHYGRVPWPKTVWVREASVLENPGYSRETFETRKAEAQGDPARMAAFEEQYLGRMKYATGRVWRSFSEDENVRPMPAPELIRGMRLGLGIDTGACTAILLCGVDATGHGWVLGESYLESPPGGIYAHFLDTEAMLTRVLVPVHGDVPLAWIVGSLMDLVSIDPASQHKAEVVDRWDCSLSTPQTVDARSVLQTIDRIEDLFATNRLTIVDDCINTIDQIHKYVWKLYKAPQGQNVAPVAREPQKGYDHCCDALRFGMLPLMDRGVLDVPPTPIEFAAAWEHRQREALFGPLKRAMALGKERHGI